MHLKVLWISLLKIYETSNIRLLLFHLLDKSQRIVRFSVVSVLLCAARAQRPLHVEFALKGWLACVQNEVTSSYCTFGMFRSACCIALMKCAWLIATCSGIVS